MAFLLLILLLVLPVAEVWAAIQVAGSIGFLGTVALLMLMSAAGVLLLRRQGSSVWRSANAELAAGRMPTRQLLDGALVLVGGVCLVVPGFITGVFGALLMLPPVRALVRPLLLAWMTARATRAVRNGRMRAVFVDSSVGPDGSVRTRARQYGDVIDSEGWDVEREPDELGPPSDSRPSDSTVIESDVLDDRDGGHDESGRG
jgi:UPF0716 protein FxsA